MTPLLMLSSSLKTPEDAHKEVAYNEMRIADEVHKGHTMSHNMQGPRKERTTREGVIKGDACEGCTNKSGQRGHYEEEVHKEEMFEEMMNTEGACKGYIMSHKA